MDRTKNILAVLFVVAAFGLLFLSVRTSKTADQASRGLIAAGDAKPALDFTLPIAATGRPLRLKNAEKTGPVVLDFWATWCGPCQAELPHLETLSRKYKGRVAFYGVNSSDSPHIITAFAGQKDLTFPTLSDYNRNVAFLYGVDSIPLMVVVDGKGRTRSVVNGYDPDENVEASLSKTLDSLLAEQGKHHDQVRPPLSHRPAGPGRTRPRPDARPAPDAARRAGRGQDDLVHGH